MVEQRRSCLTVFAVVVTACLLASGCASAAEASGEEGSAGLRVVSTVAPITSIVSQVVGPEAQVRGLIPEGTDSHTFEPKPSLAKELARADVIFVNGLDLEDPLLDMAKTNRKDGALIVELGRRTIRPDEELYDFSFPRSGGKPNPHLWTNPPMGREYARIVRDVMVEQDPAHAATYRSNYTTFAERINELDRLMTEATATVPRPALLTYHDAYAYFARHYGWEVLGAIQLSSFQEPTARDVASLIRQVRSEGVPAIFGSEVFPSTVLAQIGRETGVRYVDSLRDDDLLGRPGDAEHSWLALLKSDFVTMVDSLGGDARALRAFDAGKTATDDAVYPQ